MKDYSFDSLNDKEFESLCVSLLSRRENIFIERFKSGRDQGIDGRFHSSKNLNTIIQCKHWNKSGLAALVRHLNDNEIKKIKKLSPQRYILTTSLSLSPSNKDQILSLLQPFVIDTEDILGRDDLNSLLSRFPDIEKEYIKLWFSSPSLLEHLINSATYNISRETIQIITQKAKIYVNTCNHQDALEKLNHFHTIIISGEPGIGKTTLAEQLCLHFLNKQYELIYIDDTLREAENVFNEESPQIFFFDDFLGSNYLESLRFKEDNKTTRFIKKVARQDNKRFILTSRTSILNQGKFFSQAFRTDDIEKNEFILHIDSLKKYDKAKILYNHLWHGNLPINFIDEFYHEKRYHQIIRHRNFNPRLIQFITDAERISSPDPNEYWPRVVNSLDNPADIWDHAYTTQLDGIDRSIVDLVAINGNPLGEGDLNRSFEEYIKFKALKRLNNIPADFNSCTKSVCRSFVNRQHNPSTKEVTYVPFNPSITDYLLNRYSKSTLHLSELFASLGTISSLNNLISLRERDVIEKSTYAQISKHILKHIIENDLSRSPEYIIYFVYSIAISDNSDKLSHEFLVNFIKNEIIAEYNNLDYLPEFLDLILYYINNLELLFDFKDSICAYIKHLLTIYLNHESFIAITNLLLNAKIQFNIESSDVYDLIINFWEDNFAQYVIENDLLEEYDDLEKAGEAYDKILSKLEMLFSEYAFEFDHSALKSICYNVDIHGIIESNISSIIHSYDTGSHKSLDTYDTELIDSLFERG